MTAKKKIRLDDFNPFNKENWPYLHEYHELQRRWKFKTDFLRKGIDQLSKSGNPIQEISAFILTSQLLEFKLRETISTLDLAISFDNILYKSKINRKIRRPIDFEKYTMGVTVSAFCEFEKIINNNLKVKVKKIHKLRNKFSHDLFSDNYDILLMVDDARDNLELCNEIFKELQSIHDELMKNITKDTK